MKRIILAITGASGVIYEIRLVEQLNKAMVETHLVLSEAAKKTIRLETIVSPEELAEQANFSYCTDDFVTQMIGRVMDHLGIDHNLAKRWPESFK